MIWRETKDQMQNKLPSRNIQGMGAMYAQQAGNNTAPQTGGTTQPNTNGVAVRDTLTGNYGLNNSAIGYDDNTGYVTYNGKNLLKPDWVDNGVSYVSNPNTLYNAVAGMNSYGSTAARPYLTGMGLEDSQIGYNDANGYITYGGKNLLQPNRVTNGVSYVDNNNDFLSAVTNYYNSNGKNVVKLTDYLSNTGLPFDVTYNNGMVSIGGQTFKPLFEDNGYAYVDKAELDKVLANYKDQTGLQNRMDIVNKYNEKYQPYYDKLLDSMVNRDPFSYDPEQDAAFQSYRDQYNREGDRAMRDAMGAMSGMTGGYTNSAAVTAGGQQRQYWQDKLMDRIPELQNNAYQRYLGEFDMNNTALGAVQGIDTQQFGREYGANSDLRNDILDSIDRRIDREDKAYDRSITDRDWNQYLREYGDSQGWKQKEFDSAEDWKQKYYDIDRENHETDQRRVMFEQAVTEAKQTGVWPAYAAELGIDTSIDPYTYERMMNSIDFESYKQKGDYDLGNEKDLINYKYEAENYYRPVYSSGRSSSGGSGGSSKKSSGGSSGSSGKTAVSNSDVNSWAKFFNNKADNDGYLPYLEQTSPNTYRPVNGSSETIVLTILSDNSMTDAQKADLLSKLGISDQTIATVLEDKHYMGR